MSKNIQETIRMEVARMCNLLHLNRDDIFEMCELCNFIRNCSVPDMNYRDPAKLIPMVMFIWLRYYNYIIEWDDIVRYTSLTKKGFKGYLIAFYELFPFECIMEEVIEIYMEYVSRACDMVDKIKQFS